MWRPDGYKHATTTWLDDKLWFVAVSKMIVACSCRDKVEEALSKSWKPRQSG